MGDSRLDDELLIFLNELRVMLPGVQILLAFLLTVPFSSRFGDLDESERAVFFVALLAAALATALLIAPSVYHRLHPRRDVADARKMLARFNRMFVLGSTSLVASITAGVHLVSEFLFGGVVAAITTFATGAVFVFLWFLLPLTRRALERRARRSGSAASRSP
jgi:hypothetical protein